MDEGPEHARGYEKSGAAQDWRAFSSTGTFTFTFTGERVGDRYFGVVEDPPEVVIPAPMATIDITRNHSLSLDDAKKKAEDIAKGIEQKLGIQWKWDGNTIRFEAASGAAKGTKGELVVSEKDVRVAIDLPFMLRVMKGTIEQKVNEKLSSLV